ncbi:protein FAR-RED IMPAIRED RESPONSE 1-like [Papaver somniferum]|uniref:protein FAR-RED IMPAIRED RESPONSE 1-like n=1 Tax=Papaver somniferum TaxID=3469 RepID=UPI000E6FEF80|nr:protein FAR-RED IMPAIRED RESPONSE 1-like [Papaver somniferum]
MGFESIDDAWEFYKAFGKATGFPVVKSISVTNAAGHIRSYTFTCARAGKCNSVSENTLRPQATIKCGCQANLVLRLYFLVGYVISQLNLEYNHEKNPENARYFRCNRFINSRVKKQLDLLDQSAGRLCKGYDVCVNEAGGHENMTCSKKDCRNLIDNLRNSRLGEGDAVVILTYFAKMTSEGSGFYSSVDVDETGHLRSVFWADGRSREEYKEFGEVISFDTTYLVNRYDMSFAPFVGVNHHRESILLGCGLVTHENEDSFVWLFMKWLDCMSGCAPPAIITDQAKAMQNAIEIVFPNSIHRSETKWMEMLQKYELLEKEWLRGLYEERRRWVPCYLNDIFWAGMQSTQRSESMNSFFDGYLGTKTTLKQFVEQYERASRDKEENETSADAESCSKLIPTATFFEMENQMQGMYTLSRFKEFQNELTSKMYCELIKQEEDPLGTFKYVTRVNVWIEGVDHQRIQIQMNFDVIFYSNECEVSCSCRMFEFEGILYRHVLNVLILHGVKLVPDKYIKERWRKDLKRSHTSMKVNMGFWRNTVEHDRCNNLSILFSEVADMAVKSEPTFNDVNQLLALQLKLLKKNNAIQIEAKTPEVQEKHSARDEIMDIVPMDVVDVLNPNDRIMLGRPRTNTYKTIWKHTKKNPTTNNNGNACNEDVLVVVDVPIPKTKKRGRPLGSKNKNVQVVLQQEYNGIAPPSHLYPQVPMCQYNGVVGQTHQYQANLLAPQVPMYQPWGFYQHPPPPMPMGLNGYNYQTAEV